MMPCNQPAVVIVCQHVNAGQSYDRLVMDTNDEFVDTAFCGVCAAVVEESLRRFAERTVEEQQAEADFARVACGMQSICRGCAHTLGIPDKTPNGEHVWARPVN